MRAFVTGTDTGVGKTYVTALLTRSLRAAGRDTVGLKPICCGPRDDVETLRAAVDHEVEADAINPVWLETPAAPLVAARAARRPVDCDHLVRWLETWKSARASLLVEGVGGWLVPVADGITSADLAVRFGLPVVVVVANKLGCLNHTLLTVESIRRTGLECSGLILNALDEDGSVARRTNRSLLEEFCDVPILFEVGPGQEDGVELETEKRKS